jgi:tetratricopeptide (TPR) repeat protein
MEPLSLDELRRLGTVHARAREGMDEYNRGNEYQRRGEFQKAREAFGRTADMGVTYVSARAALSLGILLEEHWQDLEGARRAYERAAALGPDTEVAPAADLLLGNIHALQGDGRAAFQAFRRAYQSGLPTVAPKAIFALGLLYENIGDDRGARLAFEAAVETEDPSVAAQAAAKLRTQ